MRKGDDPLGRAEYLREIADQRNGDALFKCFSAGACESTILGSIFFNGARRA